MAKVLDSLILISIWLYTLVCYWLSVAKAPVEVKAALVLVGIFCAYVTAITFFEKWHNDFTPKDKDNSTKK